MNLPLNTISRVGFNRLLLLLLWLFCTALLPGLARQAQAAEMQGLYQSEIPMQSRDDPQERTRAFGRGLEEVLLKLSGRTDTLENPQIRRQIQNPQALVEGWAYQTRAASGAGQEPPQLYLQINYFQPDIQRVLDSAGVPLWPANRPDTLVWVVVQDELGERMLLDPAVDETALYQLLQDNAKRRALPLRLPLMDLQDRLALAPEQVWSVDQAAIQAAAQRYGSESILVLRLFRTLTGETFTKATYLFRERLLEYESFEATEPAFLEAAVNLVAEELAGIFAVRLSGVDNSTRANLEVSGVRSLDDYAAILSYLNGLAVVNSVQVLAVADTTLSLQLSTGGQLRQLLETLGLERRLQQLSDPARSGQEFMIQYRWQTGP